MLLMFGSPPVHHHPHENFRHPVATNRIEHSAACEVWELAESPTTTRFPAALPHNDGEVLMLTGQGGEDAVASALLAKALLDISPHSPGKAKHVAWLTERCRRYRLPTPESCCAIKRSLRVSLRRYLVPGVASRFHQPVLYDSSRTHDVTVPVLQVVGIIVWTLTRRLDHR